MCITVNKICKVGGKRTEGRMIGKGEATRNREKDKKDKKRTVRPEGRGPLLWPLSLLESMRRGMEYPAQNPDRQTKELQL